MKSKISLKNLKYDIVLCSNELKLDLKGPLHNLAIANLLVK